MYTIVKFVCATVVGRRTSTGMNGAAAYAESEQTELS